MAIQKEQVLTALAHVLHPQEKKDLLALDMIQDLIQIERAAHRRQRIAQGFRQGTLFLRKHLDSFLLINLFLQALVQPGLVINVLSKMQF